VLDPFQQQQQQEEPQMALIPEVKGRIHSTESFSTIDGGSQYSVASAAGVHLAQLHRMTRTHAHMLGITLSSSLC
jgi:hypothetical protein